MTDILERLRKYNEDWRTRAGSAAEVNEAIAEIERLRASVTTPPSMPAITDDMIRAGRAAHHKHGCGAVREIFVEMYCTAPRHATAQCFDRTTEWQPIETAPKDGSRCDVWTVYYDAYQSRGERHVDAQYREQHAAWFDLYGNKLDWSELDESDDMKPRGRKTTHWIPLPAPPSTV